MDIDRREFIKYSAGMLFLMFPGLSISPSGKLLALFDDDDPSRIESGPSGGGQVRGIYVPGWKAVSRSGIDRLISFLKEYDLNTVMVDVKNSWGDVFFTPKTSLACAIDCQAKTVDGSKRSLQLEYLRDQINKNNFRLIARHVMFRDGKLYDAREDLRLWERKSEKWVNMKNNEVVDYNLSLLEEEASFGFHEIVLDYIRFPATEQFGSHLEKCEIIDEVVAQAGKRLNSVDIDFSVQIFGYAAWHHSKAGVGQRISTLDPHVDVIYPMLYPSHFWAGSFGFKDPTRHPEEIIAMGYREAVKKVASDTRVIPMIQAFSYSEEEIASQLNAVWKCGMPGYVCWNPSGDYQKLQVPRETIGAATSSEPT